MDGNNEVLFMAELATAHATKSGADSTHLTSAITTESEAAAQTTAVTDCHMNGSTQFCVDGQGNEGYMSPAPTGSSPASYTGCHSHATETFCVNNKGDEVKFVVESEDTNELSLSESGEMDCHFHAGVEHCVKAGHSESGGEKSCDRVDRDYDIPVRIGTLFAVLATSTIGVFLPMLIRRLWNTALDGTIVMFFRQFGTGVILSTALVHLTTHAQLMFANDCLTLHYESTSTAITLAGLFLGFLADFATTRFLRSVTKSSNDNVTEGDSDDLDSNQKETCNAVVTSNSQPDSIPDGSHDKVAVLMLEAGIIFHSVLVGLTTVVAGDSYYITLFIVILFHQAFEGVALGSKIAELTTVSVLAKIAMGVGFAITTPVGMGIGIGTLKHFNGNDPSTVIAIGTLDALSAGVLLWVGVIEMLAHDWLHGALVGARIFKVLVSLVGLVAGMVLMSFLGKWT